MLKFCKLVLKSSKSKELHLSMKPIVKDRLIKAVLTKSKNEEMCLEMLGIMSSIKIGKEWTDILLSNDKFLDYLEKVMINGIN